MLPAANPKSNPFPVRGKTGDFSGIFRLRAKYRIKEVNQKKKVILSEIMNTHE